MNHFARVVCVLGMTAVTYWNHWLMELQYSVLVSVAMVLHSWPIYEAQQKPRRQRTLMCEVTIVFYRLNALRWRAYLSSPKE